MIVSIRVLLLETGIFSSIFILFCKLAWPQSNLAYKKVHPSSHQIKWAFLALLRSIPQHNTATTMHSSWSMSRLNNIDPSQLCLLLWWLLRCVWGYRSPKYTYIHTFQIFIYTIFWKSCMALFYLTSKNWLIKQTYNRLGRCTSDNMHVSSTKGRRLPFVQQRILCTTWCWECKQATWGIM